MADRHLAVAGLVIGLLVGGVLASTTDALAGPPARVAVLGTSVLVGTRPGGELQVREARVQGYVSGVEDTDPTMVMRLDIGAEPGDSGGPVVDGDGRLVGIVYLRERVTGRALVIPISELRAALAGTATVGNC